MTVEPNALAGDVPVLEVRHLSVRFGGNVAVDNLDLTLRRSERVGLIGPNGAGKSTCVNAVSGYTRCAGEVRLDGDSLRGTAPFRRARRGLVRTFQHLELFDSMSVSDNVTFGAGLAGSLSSKRSRHARVDEVLELLDLSRHRDQPVSRLAYGTRKVVELARALVSEPKVLLLDEPMAGLDTAEKTHFVNVLRGVFRELDAAVLLIEHDMFAVEELTQSVYVLNAGKLIASGPFRDIAKQQVVIDAYLGA